MLKSAMSKSGQQVRNKVIFFSLTYHTLLESPPVIGGLKLKLHKFISRSASAVQFNGHSCCPKRTIRTPGGSSSVIMKAVSGAELCKISIFTASRDAKANGRILWRAKDNRFLRPHDSSII